ncbi:response regulator transcription factor [Evansella tamaricis]|uniref:Response regulator transcription factor n=1 Tax=Evansella tamaricis TaxID=2069301 RepID=A0ABS6JJR4_9BACI|nr:response regulator transcription factor [Evansella tamaricis]MBU9713924.1 response regulator transcription factor [Evansella tamaricis]
MVSKSALNILIVDMETAMIMLFQQIFSTQRNEMLLVTSGEEALLLVKEKEFDFIFIDIQLPDRDGFEICIEIRKNTKAFIIILTGVTGEEYKVKGLEAGADDYLVKPFGIHELKARIDALYRRLYHYDEGSPENIIRHGDLELDSSQNLVRVGNEKVNLTNKEYELLKLLMKNRGQVFSRQQLLEKLWGKDFAEVHTRTVDTHIKTLRVKLKNESQSIQAVWGIGYKFERKEN